jgi:hypothetical protein
MYAKLKPNSIPTARVKRNVFPTAGLSRPETTSVSFQGTVTTPALYSDTTIKHTTKIHSTQNITSR